MVHLFFWIVSSTFFMANTSHSVVRKAQNKEVFVVQRKIVLSQCHHFQNSKCCSLMQTHHQNLWHKHSLLFQTLHTIVNFKLDWSSKPSFFWALQACDECQSWQTLSHQSLMHGSSVVFCKCTERQCPSHSLSATIVMTSHHCINWSRNHWLFIKQLSYMCVNNRAALSNEHF